MSTRGVEVLAIGLASHDVSLFVNEFPRENSKLEIHEMIEQGGGPAANAAYLLSLWGVNCAFAGLMGDDIDGQRMREEFKRVGTDLSLSETRHGHTTAVSVILVNTTNGSRTVVNRKAALATLDLDASRLLGMNPKVLLFDGHELQASLSALAAFPDASSILDAGSLRPGTEEPLSKVKYLVTSERFALQASGLAELTSETARCECLRTLRARSRADATIVVTLGSRGLIYEEAGRCHHLPACSVMPVDTTGAGDIFHGAFAYGVLRDLSLNETLRLATKASSLSVQWRGGRTSTPTLAALKNEGW